MRVLPREWCTVAMQGRTVGVFSKDAFQGPFVEEWREALDQAKLKQVQCTDRVGSCDRHMG